MKAGSNGANAITALAAATIGSTGTTNVLYWGDGGGNIYFDSSPTLKLPSISTNNKCATASSSITSLAVVPSPTPLLFYTTSGGIFEGALTASTGACSSSFSSSNLSTSRGAVQLGSRIVSDRGQDAVRSDLIEIDPVRVDPDRDHVDDRIVWIGADGGDLGGGVDEAGEGPLGGAGRSAGRRAGKVLGARRHPEDEPGGIVVGDRSRQGG